METFDLSRLTDFDFEAVCKDLFEEELGLPLEIFARGPDEGVDLRHFADGEAKVVIQCKHWHRSTRSKLVDHVHQSEAPKLRRLLPNRYLLATSVDLTKNTKDKLYKILQPYTRTPGDIYGLQDLNALLRKHEHVVRRHLRLWLTSATVLRSLLSKRIVSRSQALTQDINDTLRTYAVNPTYSRALAMLEQRHVCVIAGTPGIGKTTLARVLCANYLASGYELVEVSEDIEEANSLWDDTISQIFYYDDFLGQTSLNEKLGKNEDSRLLSLMRRAAISPNKIFILTTREYILAQARQRYERLARHPFDMQTCVIDFADYSRNIKAQILYNHVYASPLPRSAKAPFALPSTYGRIIGHRNFNPRIISATLDEAYLLSENPDVATEMLANLDDPSRLWDHIVDHQLGLSEIFLLKIVFSFLAPIPLKALEKLWRSYGNTLRELRMSLAILDGTMIRSFERMETLFDQEGNICIELHNPSVRDYFIKRFSSDMDELASLVNLVRHFEQLETLWIGMPVRGGGPLLVQYQELRDEIQEIATIAVESAPVQLKDAFAEENDYARRAWFLLEMAKTIKSPTIRSLGLEQVASFTRCPGGAQWEDLETLLHILADDGTLEGRQALEEVTEWATDWAVSDVRSWDAIEWASEVLDTMQRIHSGPATDEALNTLDRIRHEYATDAFEDWSRSDCDPIYPESEIVAIIDYYADDSESHFDGYKETLARLKELERFPHMPWNDDHSHSFQRAELNESEQVRNMMQNLGGEGH